MTTYLGVGAVRIQTWLGHTPKLTHLRGASQALHEYTAYQPVGNWLAKHAQGATLEPAAGDVDGVIALNLAAATKPAQIAAGLVAHLQRELPGVQWAAWWCDADSYLAALSRSLDPDDAAVGRLTALPPLQDACFVESCPQCRREPFVLDAGRDGQQTGADCAARDAAQQRAMGQAKGAASMWSEIPGEWPDSFDVLAARGGLSESAAAPGAVGRRDSRSHLATIAADGNGIGGLNKAISDCKMPLARLYEETVALINDVMRQAVIDAARQAGAADASVKVVIPHYVGGDDALLSVPAASAWAFAIRLAQSFELLRQRLDGVLDADIAEAKAAGYVDAEAQTAGVRGRIAALSLGVGVVFASASHPFAQTSELAHRAMRRAKKDTKGRRSAIAWIDLTSDSLSVGGESGGMPSIDVDVASRQLGADAGGDGAEVFAFSPSARGQLGSLLRDTLSDDRRTRQDAVDQWAKRTRVAINTPLDHLPAALSRARWWPAANLEEDDR